MKHWIATLGIATIFGLSSAWAGTPLSQLVRSEQQLSTQIKQAYLQGKNPASLYNKLIQVHQKIRHASVDPEISNMATFLSFCLQDLRQALVSPRNPGNIEIVVDLDSTIQEGAAYIRNLSRGKALAAR
jgi:hypothetical protein